MKSTENVSRDLKALREKQGLTLEMLAERINYSVAAVNGLENKGAGSKRLRSLVLNALTATAVGQGDTPPVGRDVPTRVELARALDRARCAEDKLFRVCKLLSEISQVLESGGRPGKERSRAAIDRRPPAKPRRPRLRDVANVSLRIFGTIPAGWPQNFDQTSCPVRYEQVSSRRFPTGAFGLDVRGDSMNAATPEPIRDGETVVLLSPEQREPRHNDIVAALCDGQTTLKRLQCPPGGKCVLCAESSNPVFSREIIPVHELTIQGVVVGKL